MQSGVPELFGKGHRGHQHIIAEPLNLPLFEIDAHADDGFILNAEFGSEGGVVASNVDAAPEGEADEVLAVDVCAVLGVGPTKADDEVGGGGEQLEFEVDLALLAHAVGAIQEHEFVAHFRYLVLSDLVVFSAGALPVSFELEHLPVLERLFHEVVHPLAVLLAPLALPASLALLFAANPGYLQLFREASGMFLLQMLVLEVLQENAIKFGHG